MASPKVLLVSALCVLLCIALSPDCAEAARLPGIARFDVVSTVRGLKGGGAEVYGVPLPQENSKSCGFTACRTFCNTCGARRTCYKAPCCGCYLAAAASYAGYTASVSAGKR